MKNYSFEVHMVEEETPSIGFILLSLSCLGMIKIIKFFVSIPGLFFLLVLNLLLYFVVGNKELNFGITIFLIVAILTKLYLSYNKKEV